MINDCCKNNFPIIFIRSNGFWGKGTPLTSVDLEVKDSEKALMVSSIRAIFTDLHLL